MARANLLQSYHRAVGDFVYPVESVDAAPKFTGKCRRGALVKSRYWVDPGLLMIHGTAAEPWIAPINLITRHSALSAGISL